jgi:hypothetical protein
MPIIWEMVFGQHPILADTGYGAAGGSTRSRPARDVVININARIAEDVVSTAST